MRSASACGAVDWCWAWARVEGSHRVTLDSELEFSSLTCQAGGGCLRSEMSGA